MMKINSRKFISLITLSILTCQASAQSTAQKVGNNPTIKDASAVLEVESTNKGFLPPRLTTVQRNAITLPATGLVIFNVTLSQLQVNTGTPAAPVWTSATVEVLPVANGGTGLATIPANSVMIGNGTSPVTTVAPGASGQVLTSNGTSWVSTPSTANAITASNGLTRITNDIRLGGTLTANTNIAGDFNLSTTGTGNFGIGTNTPTQKLSVSGNIVIPNQSALLARNAGNTADEAVLYGRFSDNGTYLDGGIGGLSLRTNNGIVTNQYLGTNGNTGFALPSNTTPTQRIDVNSGNVRIREINLAASTSTTGTDRVVVADANGVLKTVEASIRTVGAAQSGQVLLPSDETILVNATANVFYVLSAASSLKGKKYIIKKIDQSGNSVRIVSAGGDIDNLPAGSGVINISVPYQTYIVQSDGIQWYIIGKYN